MYSLASITNSSSDQILTLAVTTVALGPFFWKLNQLA
jgi:hypothetical protein